MRTRRIDEIEAEDPVTWLDGLPADAQGVGRHMLEQFEVTDRERFRAWAVACAAADAIPRHMDRMDELARANAVAVQLLHDPPQWWRERY